MSDIKREPIDLDLDALTDDIIPIKLNNKRFELKSPDLHQILKLMKLARGMKEVTITEDNIDTIIDQGDQLMDQFKKVVPEIKDENISMKQMYMLMEVLGQEAIPTETKQLEEKGISISTDEKKTHLSQSEKSQDSSDFTEATQ